MRLLNLEQFLKLHHQIITQSGGSDGIRDQAALESALAQPEMSFDGQDLYPTILEKAAAMGFSLINNHPFIDGNKRIGHAAMEVTLLLNGYEIKVDVDEQEKVILSVASGEMQREPFVVWMREHVTLVKKLDGGQ